MNDFLSKRSGTLRIVGIYALVGCLWIYTSDSLLGWFVQDSHIMVNIAIYRPTEIFNCDVKDDVWKGEGKVLSLLKEVIMKILE